MFSRAFLKTSQYDWSKKNTTTPAFGPIPSEQDQIMNAPKKLADSPIEIARACVSETPMHN